MRSESVVVAQILAKYGAHPELRIRRNNSGALFDPKGRLVRFGLPGSGDIEGFIAPRARFLSVECKTSAGQQRTLQESYGRMVVTMGGVRIVARSLVQFEIEMEAVLSEERGLTRLLAGLGP